MTSKATVDDFIGQKSLAVVGVSRNSAKFGNAIYKTLKEKGYQVFPVNPKAESIEGDRCYPTLSALPEKVGGVVVVVPPAQTEQVVKEAQAAGITRVWLQQGAESPAAIQFCQQNGLQTVHGECILMFASGKQFPHNMHRWVWGLIGKLPK
jgi:predicted CoA-binding protein